MRWSRAALVLGTVLVLVPAAGCTAPPGSAGSPGPTTVATTSSIATTTETATTSSPSESADGEGGIGVVGDSLTRGLVDHTAITDELARLGFPAGGIRVDGVNGRRIAGPATVAGQSLVGVPNTLDVIDRWRRAGFDPRVWLVALGTNNAAESAPSWRADVAAVLDRIESGGRDDYAVYWVGLGFAQPHHVVGEFQAALVAAARADRHLRACDYEAYLVPLRADARWPAWWDGIHNTPSGYDDVRLPFYLQAVAHEAPGATAEPTAYCTGG